MKSQLNEIKKLQKLAGLLKEDIAELSTTEKEYAEAQWNMDKFMDDNADFNDYYNILQSKNVEDMVDFLINNVTSEETMMRYFPKNGSIDDFANYLINNK
jgi:chemotaxis methyl-accepting protein methylase